MVDSNQSETCMLLKRPKKNPAITAVCKLTTAIPYKFQLKIAAKLTLFESVSEQKKQRAGKVREIVFV